MILQDKSEKVQQEIFKEYEIEIDNLLTDDAIIFGGIIRDILTNEDISRSKDIDIIVAESSLNTIEAYLKGIGYARNKKEEEAITSQYKKDTFEFHVWTGLQSKKRIDLMIPGEQFIRDHGVGFITDLMSNMRYLLNVDLSSSLIGYNKHLGIIYNDKNTFKMLDKKIFKINTKSMLYNEDATEERADKLEHKEWMRV